MRAVLERDFLSTASRGRAFILRALVAATVTAVIWLAFLESRYAFMDRPDAAAGVLFVGGSVALLCMMLLVTPPAVVGSILEERQRETLPLVLASPVGPRRLAAAKLLARSMAVLQWALAALVPLFTVTLLGGVAITQVADLAMLTVGVVLELAAWGVWISSFTGRLATGAILSYLVPVVRWAITLGLLGLCATIESPFDYRVESREARSVLWTLGTTTPIPGVGCMAQPGLYGSFLDRSLRGLDHRNPAYVFAGPSNLAYSQSNFGFTTTAYQPIPPIPPPVYLSHPAATYLLFSLAFAGFVVLVAGRRLALEAEPRTGLFASVLDRKRARRTPPDGGNPVAWKEQRLLNTAASRPLFYAVIALLAGGEVFYLAACGTVLRSSRDFMELGLGFAAAHSSLIGLVAVVAGAAAMAHERTTGSLDLLRASPLTPTEILRGKLGGLLRGLGFLALIPLAHLLILVVAGFMDPVTAVAAALLDGTFLLFFSMVGMIAGLSSARMGPAVSRGAMVYGVFLVGIPLAAALLGVGFGQRRGSESLVMGCPPVTTYCALEASMQRLHPLWAASTYYRGGLRHHQEAALWWVAVYGGASLLGWRYAPRLLARRFEREREEG